MVFSSPWSRRALTLQAPSCQIVTSSGKGSHDSKTESGFGLVIQAEPASPVLAVRAWVIRLGLNKMMQLPESDKASIPTATQTQLEALGV